jgi:DNA-binding NarL/FixJ family response regulator
MHSVILLQTDGKVAERLRAVIAGAPDLKVVAAVTSIAQVRQLFEQATPDLLVSDLRMRDGPLTGLMAELRDASGHERRPRVIAAAISFADRRLMEALRRGCDGYFIKDCGNDVLLSTIRQVLAGESTMAPEIARKVKAHFNATNGKGTDFIAETLNPLRLTDHEQLILDLVEKGDSVADIAKCLRTNARDVGMRIRAIYRKLQFDLSTETLTLAA